MWIINNYFFCLLLINRMAYESIAQYRLYLDLNNEDIEFTTGNRSAISLNEKNMATTMIDQTIETFPTSYEVITNTPTISMFKNFINRFSLHKHLVDKFTLFIPTNSSMEILVKYLNNNSLANAQDVFKYHKLDSLINPVQLFDRKLKLQTSLPGHYILTNGPNIMMQNHNNQLSNLVPNKILQSIETSNGFIYILEYPLLPYLV